ncbi:MAG: AI-2E family transporter [Solirubrobacteraceae bacterium]
MGIAFAAPLAVIVGVFDLLPLVGATIAAFIVGIVTLFYSFPTDTIIWAVVVIVYQQIENNVLSPIVYRRTVQVPGMLVLISVLVGATLGGIIGALLAIPAAAAIQIVVRDILQQRKVTEPRDHAVWVTSAHLTRGQTDKHDVDAPSTDR